MTILHRNQQAGSASQRPRLKFFRQQWRIRWPRQYQSRAFYSFWPCPIWNGTATWSGTDANLHLRWQLSEWHLWHVSSVATILPQSKCLKAALDESTIGTAPEKVRVSIAIKGNRDLYWLCTSSAIQFPTPAKTVWSNKSALIGAFLFRTIVLKASSSISSKIGS